MSVGRRPKAPIVPCPACELASKAIPQEFWGTPHLLQQLKKKGDQHVAWHVSYSYLEDLSEIVGTFWQCSF